jgi:hypothetical protein
MSALTETLQALEERGIPPSSLGAGFALFLIAAISLFVPGFLWFLLSAAVATAALWLPILLGFAFWRVWVRYVRARFLFNEPHVLLEVKLGPEVATNIAAMEVFLLSLHLPGGEMSFWDKYWAGKTRALWSLELAAIDGKVRFFIRARERERELVEARLYAQFPDIEVALAEEDYARLDEYDERTMELYGTEYALARPDPYPIKTHVDAGLSHATGFSPNDPLMPLLQFLGSRTPDERAWVQIIFRAHKAEQARGIFGVSDKLHEDARREIEHILTSVQTAEGVAQDVQQLDKRNQAILAAIERSLTKPAFDCGIRAVYFAPHASFDEGAPRALDNLFAPFASPDLNGFISFGGLSKRPLLALGDSVKKRFFKLFRRRAYFYGPYVGKPFILNTEELSTLYHFPGAGLELPALERVGARRLSPPENLPL